MRDEEDDDLPEDADLLEPEDEEEDDEGPAPARREIPRGGPDKTQRAALRTLLMSMRDKLARTGKDLANETLKSSGQTFKIDHMADAGTDNAEQDVNLSLMEGGSEMFDRIEAAILKLDGQLDSAYGLCEDCAELGDWGPETGGPWIPVGRLQALPYARLCVRHQEEREEG